MLKVKVNILAGFLCDDKIWQGLIGCDVSFNLVISYYCFIYMCEDNGIYRHIELTFPLDTGKKKLYVLMTFLWIASTQNKGKKKA